jgi:hypothetical protein
MVATRGVAACISIALVVVFLMAPLLTTLVNTPTTKLPTADVEFVVDSPAGFRALVNTTAVAGYYCVRGLPGTGWGVMLNAYLANASGIAYITQVFIVSTTPVPTLLTSAYDSNVWLPNGSLAHAGFNIPAAPACGWLVVSIRGGVAYFGFSIDGRHVIWFDSYHVGNVAIIEVSMRVGGPGSGSQAVLDGPFKAVLAIYYWGDGSWHPFNSLIFAKSNVVEGVNYAWVSVSSECGAVVSWPNPTSEVMCPNPPSFKP